MDAPQEVVRTLERGRRFEARHADALRVERAEDRADRRVFPARIHRLKDDEKGALVFSVQTFLETVGVLEQARGLGFGCVAVEVLVVAGQRVGEAHRRPGGDGVPGEVDGERAGGRIPAHRPNSLPSAARPAC